MSPLKGCCKAWSVADAKLREFSSCSKSSGWGLGCFQQVRDSPGVNIWGTTNLQGFAATAGFPDPATFACSKHLHFPYHGQWRDDPGKQTSRENLKAAMCFSILGQ